MRRKKAVRVTVTLWARAPGGVPMGVSEFLLDEPDEARFVQRARGLFAMVSAPVAPVCARILMGGVSREIDATRETPERMAVRLWEETRALGPT